MTTIYDVAKAAGVSPKTVSRVLNGGNRVRESTQAAVAQAMADLGFVPSSAARTMRSNRSGLIGLVTSVLSGAYERPDQGGLPDMVLVQAIQRRLEPRDRTLLIADSGGRPERVASLLRTFAEHRVEGLLYVAPFHQRVSLPTLDSLPHTVIVNGFDDAGTPSVVPDDYAGQRALVERLIAAGHRRIAYLTLLPMMVATQERGRAWCDALQAAGLEAAPELLRTGDPPEPSLAEETRIQSEAIDHFLSLPDPPTAICTGNDRMAMRVLALLQARGLRVPDDLSLSGYDDHRLLSETMLPALTTVELPYRRMGESAADLLLDLIEGGDAIESNPSRVQGALRWRDSVAPPVAAARPDPPPPRRTHA